MNAGEYVDKLFGEYEESDELRDFKEELRGNLQERIRDLVVKGLDESEAFYKATNELGDISALADEISLKRKQEVFEEMYMKTRSYISAKRMAAYIACAGIFLFGMMASAVSGMYSREMAAWIGALMPFSLVSATAVIYLYLTQETARQMPMDKKRAALYSAASAVFLFGVFVFALTFFVRDAGLPAAVATLIPFCLPSGLLLAFLILTETERAKPWVQEQQRRWIKHQEARFESTEEEARYGLVCGALWIFAFALFLALGFVVGFRISWLIFLFAVGVQLMVEYRFTSSTKR